MSDRYCNKCGTMLSHRELEQCLACLSQSELPETPGSALAVIEAMRQKGYCVQLDNGLDGTWEAQFYKPSMYGSTNEEIEKTYGAGATLLLAVTEAAKNPPNDKVSDGCRPRAHDGTQNV